MGPAAQRHFTGRVTPGQNRQDGLQDEVDRPGARPNTGHIKDGAARAGAAGPEYETLGPKAIALQGGPADLRSRANTGEMLRGEAGLLASSADIRELDIGARHRGQ